MAPGGWAYYARDVAVGLDDYYGGHGEEPGRWMGRGAVAAGVGGLVEVEQLGRLFGQGRHPVSGEALGCAWDHHDPDVVAGYSVSLSAPKSVSLLWGLGDHRLSQEVRSAHDAAVTATVDYLEEHAAFSRAGKAGMFQLDSDGLVVAAYVHRTSRTLDPQLHTHLLVSAKVRRSDGAWRALDGRDLFAQQKAASGVYQAALRTELAARLGVDWDTPSAHGHADVAGVPEELRRHFSARREQVQARGAARVAVAEAERGRDLSAAERAVEYQRAAYETRPSKGDELHDTMALRARWMAEAEAAGHPPRRWVPAVLGRDTPPVTLDRERLGVDVLATLGEERSTWGRAEVVAEVCRRLPPRLVSSAERVLVQAEELTDEVLAHGDVVRLAAPPSAVVPRGLCRRDGLGTHERHGAARYTTRATLALEASVLDFAANGRQAGVAAVPAEVIEEAVANQRLDDDQAEAVRRLCGGGEALVCLVGPAGAGKTRSLAAARGAWAVSGVRVRGLAPSANAASVLVTEAGVPADTVAKFLWENATGDPAPPWRLDYGEVVIVDEAAQLATRDMARLAWAVAAAGGKLVLVGDHRQLASVEAGGMFRLLVADTKAAELTGVRRFVEPWEREASRRVRDGDTTVVGEYERQGRLSGGTREDALEAAFDAWRRARAAGESVVVMAGDHESVNTLALRARAVRVAAGEVARTGIVVGAQTVGAGDEVVTTQNDRRLLTSRQAWVRNGDRWVVRTIDPDGSMVVEDARRGRVRLPTEYSAEHLVLAYAVTVHKAQGLTVDRGILLVDETTRAEAVYVGMTRGRLSNHAYVVCEHEGDEHGRGAVPTPAEILARVVGRPGAELSATETLRQELARSEDLAYLMPVLLQAHAYIDARAGRDLAGVLPTLRAAAAEEPDHDRLAGTLARRLDQARGAVGVARERKEALRTEVEALARPRGLLKRADHGLGEATYLLSQAEQDLARAANDATRLASEVRRVGPPTDGAAAARLGTAERSQAARNEWLAEHPTEAAWQKDLVNRVSRRRGELGRSAEERHPEHVVRLIGCPQAGTDDRQEWRARAAAIEAYRERWRVEPDRLGREDDLRGEQAREWNRVEVRCVACGCLL